MPQRPAYQHVIFDFDGTLVDSAPAILATFANILEEARITPATPLTRSLIGPPLIPTLRKISGSNDEVLIGRLASRFKIEYDEHKLPLTVAYAGVSEMLRNLHDRALTLHIATNKRERPTKRLLDIFAWRSLFTSVYCVDSPPKGFTEKAEMLARLLEEQEISVADAVFVGDTPSDGLAAAANSLPFLGIGWGYGDWTQTASGAMPIVDSAERLTHLISRS
jgi:phosphoglycolate phosphatase